MIDGPLGERRPAASADASRWRVARLATTASSNQDVLDRARAGDPGHLWVVAERQTQGRGRRGRVWTSEPGNLYASALLIDPAVPPHLPELPFVAALAVADAVAAHLPRGRAFGIKWPNDLLIAGRKVAGILLESGRTPSGAMAVAVGIGINCRHHPFGTETPATDLLIEGIDVPPERLFDDLLVAFAGRLETWARGDGFAGIRAAWLERALGIGDRIRVRLVEGEDHGIFEAIDTAGHLILVRDDGSRRAVSAGDVFFASIPHEET